MKAETFFENFGHLADAPNGVEKLRELVLQMAVRGQLTQQKLEAESADKLLEKAKRGKKVGLIDKSEQPFTLPINWRWIQFGDVFDIQGGNQPPKSMFKAEPQEGYIRLLQIRDFGDNSVPTYIPKDSVKRFCTPKDVMLARYGASVGKIFMGQDGAYNVALTKVVFLQQYIYNHFVYLLLRAPIFQDHLRKAPSVFQVAASVGGAIIA